MFLFLIVMKVLTCSNRPAAVYLSPYILTRTSLNLRKTMMTITLKLDYNQIKAITLDVVERLRNLFKHLSLRKGKHLT